MRRSRVFLPIAALVILSATISLLIHQRHFETCETCGSVQATVSRKLFGLPIYKDKFIRYNAPGSEDCKHIWRPGVTGTTDKLVDGTIVLVHKNGTYGAVKIISQHINPSSIEYEWWYRKDGRALFTDDDTEVQHGVGHGEQVRFGPFHILWLSGMEGEGYLAYDHFPGETPRHAALRICVTSAESLEGIDGRDACWKYRVSPVDSGKSL